MFLVGVILFSTLGIVGYGSSYTVGDLTGLQDGETYNLLNYSNYYFLEGSVGNTVHTDAPSDDLSAVWTLDILDYGYCYLKNDGKALMANSSGVTITANISSASQWLIINRVSTGTYAGLYTIRCGNYVVSVDDDGNLCSTTTYTPGSYWSITESTAGTATIHGFYYEDSSYTITDGYYNTLFNHSNFLTTFDDFGYSVVQRTNSTHTNAFSDLQSSDIFLFHGHGAAGRIVFYYAKGSSYGRIAANSGMGLGSGTYYINNLADNQLKSARCVLFVGCSTSADTSNYDIVAETFAKGARFALGVEKTFRSDINTTWVSHFLTAAQGGGYTLLGSILYAERSLGLVTATGEQTSCFYPAYYIGDTCQYLGVN